jgi:hypothetical protein
LASFERVLCVPVCDGDTGGLIDAAERLAAGDDARSIGSVIAALACLDRKLAVRVVGRLAHRLSRGALSAAKVGLVRSHAERWYEESFEELDARIHPELCLAEIMEEGLPRKAQTLEQEEEIVLDALSHALLIDRSALGRLSASDRAEISRAALPLLTDEGDHATLLVVLRKLAGKGIRSPLLSGLPAELRSRISTPQVRQMSQAERNRRKQQRREQRRRG